MRGQGFVERPLTLGCFAREKDGAHAQRTTGVELESGRSEEKIARNRGHDADAVATFAVGGNRTPMRQTGQRGKGLSQNFVSGLIAQRGHESDATGVVVET